jgi:hypothetical protein
VGLSEFFKGAVAVLIHYVCGSAILACGLAAGILKAFFEVLLKAFVETLLEIAATGATNNQAEQGRKDDSHGGDVITQASVPSARSS